MFLDLIEFLSAYGVKIRTKSDGGRPHVEIEGCDGTDAGTREWVSVRGHDLAGVLGFLDRHGCACDCAVLEQVGDSFPEFCREDYEG